MRARCFDALDRLLTLAAGSRSGSRLWHDLAVMIRYVRGVIGTTARPILEAVERRLDRQLESRFQRLSRSIDGLADRAEQLEERVTRKIDALYSRVDGRADGLIDRVQALEHLIGNRAHDLLSRVDVRTDGALERIQSFEQHSCAEAETVVEILDLQRQRLAAIEERLANIAARVTELSTGGLADNRLQARCADCAALVNDSAGSPESARERTSDSGTGSSSSLP